MKLTNVARASLEELRLDYEDFLRQRRLLLWARDDPRRTALVARRPANLGDFAVWARAAFSNTCPSVSTPSIQSTYPEIVANGALVLIGVATALLDRQLASQARTFETEGGFTERLYRVRSSRRQD